MLGAAFALTMVVLAVAGVVEPDLRSE
jgi:hypothetical protein